MTKVNCQVDLEPLTFFIKLDKNSAQCTFWGGDACGGYVPWTPGGRPCWLDGVHVLAVRPRCRPFCNRHRCALLKGIKPICACTFKWWVRSREVMVGFAHWGTTFGWIRNHRTSKFESNYCCTWMTRSCIFLATDGWKRQNNDSRVT